MLNAPLIIRSDVGRLLIISNADQVVMVSNVFFGAGWKKLSCAVPFFDSKFERFEENAFETNNKYEKKEEEQEEAEEEEEEEEEGEE